MALPSKSPSTALAGNPDGEVCHTSAVTHVPTEVLPPPISSTSISDAVKMPSMAFPTPGNVSLSAPAATEVSPTPPTTEHLPSLIVTTTQPSVLPQLKPAVKLDMIKPETTKVEMVTKLDLFIDPTTDELEDTTVFDFLSNLRLVEPVCDIIPSLRKQVLLRLRA